MQYLTFERTKVANWVGANDL